MARTCVAAGESAGRSHVRRARSRCSRATTDDRLAAAHTRSRTSSAIRASSPSESNTWVHDSLATAITFGVPSALQVLKTRVGRLQRAHAAVRRTGTGGRAFRRALPRAWRTSTASSTTTPGRKSCSSDWVAVDPTFGQFPADAAHLRFTIGGLGTQTELLRLMGNLKIDVLERERRARLHRRRVRMIKLTNLTKRYGSFTAVNAHRPRGAARRAVRLSRPQRRRQDDDAAHDRRHPAPDERHGSDRRHRSRRRSDRARRASSDSFPTVRSSTRSSRAPSSCASSPDCTTRKVRRSSIARASCSRCSISRSGATSWSRATATACGRSSSSRARSCIAPR